MHVGWGGWRRQVSRERSSVRWQRHRHRHGPVRLGPPTFPGDVFLGFRRFDEHRMSAEWSPMQSQRMSQVLHGLEFHVGHPFGPSGVSIGDGFDVHDLPSLREELVQVSFVCFGGHAVSKHGPRISLPTFAHLGRSPTRSHVTRHVPPLLGPPRRDPHARPRTGRRPARDAPSPQRNERSVAMRMVDRGDPSCSSGVRGTRTHRLRLRLRYFRRPLPRTRPSSPSRTSPWTSEASETARRDAIARPRIDDNGGRRRRVPTRTGSREAPRTTGVEDPPSGAVGILVGRGGQGRATPGPSFRPGKKPTRNRRKPSRIDSVL